MKNKNLHAFKLLALLTFMHLSLFGQGLILDEASYDTTPRLPLYVGSKGVSSLPPVYSLRSFCPTPDDQGSTNACVAFACGYGAYTILQAKKNGWSNATATQNAYSAAYIFNQIGTQGGLTFPSAFNFMASSGICRAATFPNQLIFKSVSPPPAAVQEAQKNKITPPPMPKIGITIPEIKDKLAQGQPIIFGAKVEANFRTRSFANGIWLPQNPSESHAMLIVGYDDNAQTLDIMNSYGKQWASGGFVKLRYADLPQVSKLAYILGGGASRGFNTEGEELPNSPPIDPMQREVVGSFQLKNLIEKAKNTEGVDSFIFEPTRVFYNADKQQYETNRHDWQVGEVFQFLASSIPSGKYLYVFSQDATHKLTIHWPPDARWAETDERTSACYAPNYGKKPVSALILSPKTQLTIPAPDEGMQISHKGEDRLIVLIADQPLPQFKQQFDKFKQASGTLSVRLREAFGNTFIPPNRIVYMKDTMTVRRFTNEPNGWIIPIILSVKTQ